MRATVLALLLVGQQAAPPTVAEIQRLYEAGQYEGVVQGAAQQTDPMILYLVGSSYEKLKRFEEARQTYQQLTARGEEDAWGLIGRSASALVTSSTRPTAEAIGAAQAAAQQALALLASASAGAQSGQVGSGNPTLAAAHYQLGAVYGYKEDYVNAVAAFDESSMLNPTFAYAHYYAGLSYSRLDRTDQMAIRFERFLRLAPRAPEASLVQSLMRSVRGR